MRNFLTEKEWNTFREIYLAEFEHAPRFQAYQNACRKIKLHGGRVPAYNTFLRKLKGGKTPETSVTKDPEQKQPAETTLPKTDYLNRLEMIVRLYRRRSEQDCDEICDYILPELNYTK